MEPVSTAVVVGVHWSPPDGGQWSVCSAGRRPRPRPALQGEDAPRAEEQATEGYVEAPPFPVNRPTLIIWYREDCAACALNKAVFARLEANPRSTGGTEFAVVRVQATPEHLRRFPHVLALPTYDVVRVTPGASSPYGPGTELCTIPNNARAPLEREFPGAFTAPR